jgi:4-amino-4-deoxy-L-arabinose transferase-like glycosyltransferase
LPNLDLAHYPSATTPLYHILLALSAFVVGSNLIALRFVSALLSLACLLTVYRYLSLRGKEFAALYFAFLFMLSPYFIGAAVRLSTDNTALLFAFLSIWAMDIKIYRSLFAALMSNIFILLAVLTRQIYAWLIGVYSILAIESYSRQHRFTDLIKSIIPVLIPVGALAYFIVIWGALNPPIFREYRQGFGLNWDEPVYIIALIGVFGSFFWAWLLKLFKQIKLSAHLIYLIAIILIIVGYLFIHPVSNSYDRSSRGGSLWAIAAHLPMLFSSSILFWLLCPLGLFYLYLLMRYLFAKRGYPLIVGFWLWLIVNMVNVRTYQKYYEPFLLFFFGYLIVSIKQDEPRYYWLGPMVLLAGFGVVDLLRFFL